MCQFFKEKQAISDSAASFTPPKDLRKVMDETTHCQANMTVLKFQMMNGNIHYNTAIIQ